MASTPAAQPITVTEIGEFISHRSCERRVKLSFNGRAEAKKLPFAERLFNALDPVLQSEGKKRENEWEKSLLDNGFAKVVLAGQGDWADFLTEIANLKAGQNVFLREITISGKLGAFMVRGRIDFILVHWKDSSPRIRLVECKASRRDRSYQRVQVAVYGMLARASLTNAIISGIQLTENDIECVVARIDESTNQAQSIVVLDGFDLAQEEADIRSLLSPGGAIQRIIGTSLDTLDYRLDAKCDSCVFSVHCYPESARLRRLQLLGLEPSVVRSLQNAGVGTIDSLSSLDLDGPIAAAIRTTPGFRHSLAALKQRAHARRSTLPGGQDPDTYNVEALPNLPASQLPEHEIDGHRLVRVYITVHYDYVENRIGAIGAHVTKSDGLLQTGFVQQDGKWQPSNEIVEELSNQTQRVVQGSDIVKYKSSPWTGRYAEDTGSEREMLQSFFQELVDAINSVAESNHAPVHFYAWSRSEIARLIEGCSRVGSGLLGHLRELLGCREPLDQLIFSCLDDEVHNRYALGWTGRGLAVACSLRWFGKQYHWRRKVHGKPVDLDFAFTQDIFDFKSQLWTDQNGQWLEKEQPGASKHRFEIRSRFYDTLTAPYWRAVWRTLPDPATVDDAKIANAIKRYNHAGERGVFKAYLTARSHALRWIDERIRYKNAEIKKPLLAMGDLIQFSLDVNTTSKAAIDFLRLDQHVAVTDWISFHLTPPAYRLSAGRTVPISNVECVGPNKLRANISTNGYDTEVASLQMHCTIQEGSFVRFTPCDPNPLKGQTFKQLLRFGSTCVVRELDWQKSTITLDVIPQPQSDLYALLSYARSEVGPVCANATLDESPTDFVKRRVERRLNAIGAHHVCDWFHPLNPAVPPQLQLSPDVQKNLKQLSESITLANGLKLAPDQVNAVLEGLSTRCQLLQGPPGTGKTMTAAGSVLCRLAARRKTGDVIIVAANTHSAVNNLLDRIHSLLGSFYIEAAKCGFFPPKITLAKIESSDSSARPAASMPIVQPRTVYKDLFSRSFGQSITILGGTTGTLLAMAEKLDGLVTFGNRPGGFSVSTLIVDEASMMVFPDFLALATLVRRDGEFMLSGDHRQLAPIMAHDWEREDRPPVILYQPYASAYDAIRNISVNRNISAASVALSALTFTFRLPVQIRELISRLYRLDSIELTGRPGADDQLQEIPGSSVWERLWQGNGGLFLIVHDEMTSTHCNSFEAMLVKQVIEAAPNLAADSTAIVTPHRAQRNLLSSELEQFIGSGKPIGIIDTVEKLQGGERPNIIVSATESEPSSIASRVEFILDLNRSNVAFSRAANRLIVVCAKTLLDHIPAELEDYRSCMLWKAIREFCSKEIGTTQLNGCSATIYTPSDEQLRSDVSPIKKMAHPAAANGEPLGL